MTPEDTAFVQAFGLKDAKLLDDSGRNRLISGFAPGDRPALLKISMPEAREEELRGATLMEWYGGDGAAQVLARHDHALLLEWIDGARLIELWQAGRHGEAVAISVRLVKRLHGKQGAPEGLLPLHAYFAEALDWEPPSPLLARAKERTVQNLSKRHTPRPLHGDIQPRNILKRGEDWCVIDPVGLSGAAAYDYANLFLNPWDHSYITRSRAHALKVVETVCGETGHDRYELIGWGIANAYWWVWRRASLGMGYNHPEAVLRTLFNL
ncbi:MAG: aminoglycoside phosphotransferase family protein [Maritimibacter sp.]